MQPRPVAVLLLVLAGMGISTAIRAQSLADVAKKEEERRKTIKAPAKVYTNKDLTAVPGGTPTPAPATGAEPSAGAADQAPATAEAPAKEKGPVKDQPYWSAPEDAPGQAQPGRVVPPGASNAHQFAGDRLREPRRPGAAGGHRARAPEGGRRPGPSPAGNRCRQEGPFGLRGRSAPRRCSARLAAVIVPPLQPLQSVGR